MLDVGVPGRVGIATLAFRNVGGSCLGGGGTYRLPHPGADTEGAAAGRFAKAALCSNSARRSQVGVSPTPRMQKRLVF